MPIKPVTYYPCPETKKLFKTVKAAEASAKKVRDERKRALVARAEAEERSRKFKEGTQWIRLNVENVGDIPGLLISKARELFGAVVRIDSFGGYAGNIPNTHACPIGGVRNWGGRDSTKPTSYPGWSGRIKGRIVSLRDEPSAHCATKYSIDRLLTSGAGGIGNSWFPKFHTSGGCPGSKDYDFDIGLYFFFDDFPKLKEKWEAMQILRKEKQIADELDEINEKDALTLASQDAEVIRLENEIAALGLKRCARSREVYGQHRKAVEFEGARELESLRKSLT